MGVGECDLVLAGCGWVWLSVTFCDLFLAGCWWVWVSLTFSGWVLGVWVSVTFFWLGVGVCG